MCPRPSAARTHLGDGHLRPFVDELDYTVRSALVRRYEEVLGERQNLSSILLAHEAAAPVPDSERPSPLLPPSKATSLHPQQLGTGDATPAVRAGRADQGEPRETRVLESNRNWTVTDIRHHGRMKNRRVLRTTLLLREVT